MNKIIKSILLFTLPFVVYWVMNLGEYVFVTEITGYGNNFAIIATLLLIAYFSLITYWYVDAQYVPTTILVLTLLSLFFLPVRERISSVDYVVVDQKIYWIERSFITNLVVVYGSDYSAVLTKRKLYELDEYNYVALLEVNIENRVQLLYKIDPDRNVYTKQTLPNL